MKSARELWIKTVGQRAFRALLRGAKLHVWRRSSPWNIWVETSNGETLWHSSPDCRIFPDSSFELVSEEGECFNPWSGRSIGAEHSVYRMKDISAPKPPRRKKRKESGDV